MFKKLFMRICIISLLVLAFPLLVFAETVGVFFDSKVPQIKFAAGDIRIAFETKGFTVEMLPLNSLRLGYANKKVVVALSSNF